MLILSFTVHTSTSLFVFGRFSTAVWHNRNSIPVLLSLPAQHQLLAGSDRSDVTEQVLEALYFQFSREGLPSGSALFPAPSRFTFTHLRTVAPGSCAAQPLSFTAGHRTASFLLFWEFFFFCLAWEELRCWDIDDEESFTYSLSPAQFFWLETEFQKVVRPFGRTVVPEQVLVAHLYFPQKMAWPVYRRHGHPNLS